MQRSLTLLFILLILLNMIGCMGARQVRHMGCYSVPKSFIGLSIDNHYCIIGSN
jgi:hypothetical protein